ncbi:hypothetical protein HHI36_006478 [Cryptolaemus montrouzieri]|uniref:Uncharacterized protein n=1 Tax=Cryptolaemus montrouzieri TaxID=559131 RepID=A0ABD2NXH3_9CUCU
MDKGISGFRTAGIWPFEPNKFSENDFGPNEPSDSTAIEIPIDLNETKVNIETPVDLIPGSSETNQGLDVPIETLVPVPISKTNQTNKSQKTGEKKSEEIKKENNGKKNAERVEKPSVLQFDDSESESCDESQLCDDDELDDTDADRSHDLDVCIVCEDLEVKTEQNPEEIKEVEVDEPQTNLVEESNVQDAPSLEEQLAAVQKQLRDLAQLPSSVQETLFVLTKQLADIVGEQTSTAEVNEEEIIPYNTLDDENQTEQVDQGENYDEPIEDLSETAMMEDSQSEVLSDICEEQEVPDADEEENKDDLLKNTEEELLENIDDSRKQLENEQLLQEEEQKLKKPIVRPIILPGGRKWVDPEDTQSKAKNPKISDDKINNMIETFSEVIVGKTKGINFLKYTPPPKNLDYLQRSEVYRLVHGMEPPVKGISIRSEKILAEQDYYTAGGN